MVLDFEDLVSMRVVAALRAANVGFPDVYKAETYLRSETGADQPFASEMLWTEGSEVFTMMHDQMVSASKHGQLAMDMLREFLVPVHGLSFSDAQQANRWEPTEGVILDPLTQFGAPCVKGTRVPTRTVWGMVQAGDALRWVAESYKLTSDEVEAAIDWERRLAS